MKLNILKREVVFQTMVSLVGLLYIISDYTGMTQGTEFFIVLFFVGVSNLLGFLIRISVMASKFNRYYFFGVILFFLLIFLMAAQSADSRIDYIIYFMGTGGVLFNLYYLAYGFYMITTQDKKKDNFFS